MRRRNTQYDISF